ncbi:amidohydrolase [Cryobacterium sp. BB307]|uniref:amidohydrolase n=1 Tax=Cryobacterium sp. BB307 TaxID=2716317 RepID=UPI0014452092|nr:amidohydrolase [Cryobacterium sp. BB307]
MILRNARVGDQLVDVEINDGLIAGFPPAGTSTGESLDLDGRWLLPGMWDHHVHFGEWAYTLRRIDLSRVTSAAEAAGVMKLHVHAQEDPNETVVGVGIRDALWPDNASTRQLLDAAVGDRSVVLINSDLHSCWLSTAAARAYGYTDHPTGLLQEDDCFDFVARLKQAPTEQHDEWVRDAALAAAARGIVGITDLDMAPNIDNWTRRFGNGFDVLRVDAAIYTQYLDQAIEDGRFSGETLTDDGLLRVGSFKILTDGSLGTRTAFCVDPYPGTHDHGLLTVPPDRLMPLLRKAMDARILLTVHAIGDEANRLALDAIEAVGGRGNIEHAQLLRREDIPRIAALGLAASVQPEHAMDDRDIADQYWAGRTDRSFMLRSLLDAGIELRFGSDAPVAPLDPWITISAAVSRARDGREPWHPEQAVTASEAITASTRSRVAEGEPADLIAVELDPYSADGEQLRSMPVALTLLAGRVTHSTL